MILLLLFKKEGRILISISLLSSWLYIPILSINWICKKMSSCDYREPTKFIIQWRTGLEIDLFATFKLLKCITLIKKVSPCCHFCWFKVYTHTHTHTHVCMYIDIYVCICICIWYIYISILTRLSEIVSFIPGKILIYTGRSISGRFFVKICV